MKTISNFAVVTQRHNQPGHSSAAIDKLSSFQIKTLKILAKNILVMQ